MNLSSSVSAKAAGRLAFFGVSEGSFVQKGTVIARLDNAEFQAAIAQAQANVAANEATLIEATSDRDQLVKEANRQRDVRSQNAMLVSQQELEAAMSRASSFSEIAFAFRVTPTRLVSGVVFAVVMGVVGGFFPARKASKMPVVQALRQEKA